jgi:hypothetical protein
VIRPPLASLLTAVVVAAAPATALAQSAGGDQYTDPLSHQPSGSSSHTSSSGGSNQTSTGTGSSGSSSSSSGTTGSGSSGTQASASTATGSTGTATSSSGLPRTGFPVGFLSFAGAILVSLGLGLRRVAFGNRS